jgi:hypothetical protein
MPNTPKTIKLQRTFGLAALKRLPGCTFIPLHMYSDKKRSKSGKVRDVGKAPIHFDWTKRRYDSAKVIARCIRENRNMGLRLGPRVLVVDVDAKNGGLVSFENLCNDLGLDPDEWPRHPTGGGGFHCFMLLPEGVNVRDTLEDEQYSGVEFKSHGRQVVWAGSRHPNGKLYTVSPDHPKITNGLRRIPTTLLEAITRPERDGVDGGGQYDQAQIAEMLAALDVLKFGDNDSWLQLMMAVHHASAGDARQEFVEWSIGDPEFAGDADWIGRRWDSLHADRNDGVTYRTLNHILREHDATHLIPSPDVGDDFDDADDSDDEFGNVTDEGDDFDAVTDGV